MIEMIKVSSTNPAMSTWQPFASDENTFLIPKEILVPDCSKIFVPTICNKIDYSEYNNKELSLKTQVTIKLNIRIKI